MDYREHSEFKNLVQLFNDEPKDRRLDATINEKNDEYVVSMKLIGFDKDELSIFIEDNTLYVEANREDIVDEDNDEFTFEEHIYSYCQRTFSLNGIDKSKLSAFYENDLVSIHLPKLKKDHL